MAQISALRFASALNELDKLGDRQMNLLPAHYKARGRTVSATMLAKKVGYKDYRGFNSCYGHLAAKVGPLVGVRARAHEHVLLLLILDYEKNADGHGVFKMRPEFKKGLKQAGWV
jgi:hypothetical protein